MWQRFTEAARKAVFYAQEAAVACGNDYVCTEHLLLGLCRDDDSTAGKAVALMGGSWSQIKAEVEKQLPEETSQPAQGMTLTPRAKRVIDLAYDQAKALGNNYIGTEHLLLGLVREGDGLAGRVLAKVGISLEAVRKAILELHASGDYQGEGSQSPSFIQRVRQKLGLGSAAPTSPPRASIYRIQTRIDFHTLHPVDQMLLAVLTDEDGEFADRIRGDIPPFHLLLPAIVSRMATTSQEDRACLSVVLADAHQLAAKAGRAEATAEDIFLACVLWTTDDVRVVLSELGLNPFRDDELPGG